MTKNLFCFSLTKLKLLDVSGNQLVSLPPMSQLTGLTSLNVSVNSLEGELTIPGLDNCAKLTVVDVSGGESRSINFITPSIQFIQGTVSLLLPVSRRQSWLS